ncbi:lytic murein transglycosylase [Williamsia sterculiae]|uniref:Membrane-bound lytic murein transglycosylase B n=1 Tax=Williamsia sterculiae TaxID=1344003 RepID=A0A1N7E0S0_9NOCA|nr:Membrane-bound lytic murein transglycosylase B [Williamsia sterculiae]
MGPSRWWRRFSAPSNSDDTTPKDVDRPVGPDGSPDDHTVDTALDDHESVTAIPDDRPTTVAATDEPGAGVSAEPETDVSAEADEADQGSVEADADEAAESPADTDEPAEVPDDVAGAGGEPVPAVVDAVEPNDAHAPAADVAEADETPTETVATECTTEKSSETPGVADEADEPQDDITPVAGGETPDAAEADETGETVPVVAIDDEASATEAASADDTPTEADAPAAESVSLADPVDAPTEVFGPVAYSAYEAETTQLAPVADPPLGADDEWTTVDAATDPDDYFFYDHEDFSDFDPDPDAVDPDERDGRRLGVPKVAIVGVLSALIGAGLLAATSSSAQLAPVRVTAAEKATPLAAVVDGGTQASLSGFAPPAAPMGAAAILGTGAGGGATAGAAGAIVNLPSGPLGIPGIVLQAYKLAADRVGAEDPACKLPWFLLAGIGRIESGHADNGAVDAAGTTLQPILGPVLNGTLAGNEVIDDTDKGAYDGDAGHDRAVGPMQFIPSTWAKWGADGNGDGKADPNNIFDATLAAGNYLCAGVKDIFSVGERVPAVLRYNNSLQYVSDVIGWAIAYSTGTMPTNPIGVLPPAGSAAGVAPPKDSASSSSKSSSSSAPPRPSPPNSSGSSSSVTPPSSQAPCFIVCIKLPTLPPPPPPATRKPAQKVPASAPAH